MCLVATGYDSLKVLFTLNVGVNTAMSPAISPSLNCLDFSIHQVNHSKYGLQPQWIRHYPNVEVDLVA